MDKIKRTKAIGALRKAGVSHENAVRILRHGYIDLDESFGPQIEELREDFPHYFEAAPEDDSKKSDKGDDRPMTRTEAIAARLRGEHVEGMTYRRKATQRPSTASKAAQENAAHLTSNHRETPPPAQKWREPVRDINAGHVAPAERPKDSSADRLANRLRGN